MAPDPACSDLEAQSTSPAAQDVATVPLAEPTPPTRSSPPAPHALPPSADKPDVLAAIHRGTDWLIRHQNPDGSWGANTLKDRCDSKSPCFNAKDNLTDNYNEGLTGLALMDLLGAGYGPDSQQETDAGSTKRYRVGDVVKNGLQWLVRRQNKNGSFSKDNTFIYNEAMATLALVEAYTLTQNHGWKEPAQHGVDFIMHAQRPSPLTPKGLWGWRYLSRMEIEASIKRADDQHKKELYDSDTSASGWAVMALRRAQVSGLNVKKESMAGAFEFTKSCTGKNGLVGYFDAKTAGAPVLGKNDQFTYHTATMSAVGLCIRIFTQQNAKDPFLELAAKCVIADLPTITADKLSVDYYYWHYGTLALREFDGPDSQQKDGKYSSAWNKVVIEALLALQDKSERACASGGWITPDRWAYAGGPLYSTAMNVLTLEEALARN